MNLRSYLTAALPLLFLGSSNSFCTEQDTPLLKTTSWNFVQSEVFSKNYNRKVTCPQVRANKSGNRLLNYCKLFPAFEWTHAVETSEGTIATMDYSIEGRMQDIPVLIRRAEKKSWELLTFRKAHFSGEVTRVLLGARTMQLRLNYDSGIVKNTEITGKGVDTDGHPTEYQDWSYDFSKKKWARSRQSLSF